MNQQMFKLQRFDRGDYIYDKVVAKKVHIPSIGRSGIITDILFDPSLEPDDPENIKVVILWDTDKPWEEDYEVDHFCDREDLAVNDAVQILSFDSVKKYIQGLVNRK